MRTIYVELDKNRRVRGWGSSKVSEVSIEVNLDLDHPFFRMEQPYRLLEDGKFVPDENEYLEEAIQFKDEELNQACKEAITSGFSHVIDGREYHFSFDMEAQSNITANQRMLSEGLVDTVTMTVKENGEYKRIQLDKSAMDLLTIAGIKHRDAQIDKYREILLPKIHAAKKLKEIEAIHWDMEMITN